MATIKSANVTKYDAGGSGDNIIADGFIKTVEKIWMDTYSITAAIPTTTSLLIARIPKGKKITDIIVDMPVIGSPATTTTVWLCTGATTAVTTYFGKLSGESYKVLTFDAGTACTLNLSAVSDIRGVELGADTAIYMMINPATTVTGGTIRTIIKYT